MQGATKSLGRVGPFLRHGNTRPNHRHPVSPQWVGYTAYGTLRLIPALVLSRCYSLPQAWEGRAFGKSCLRCSLPVCWTEASQLEEPSPVCPLSSGKKHLVRRFGSSSNQDSSQCLILPSPGGAGNGYQVAFSSTVALGSLCQQFAFYKKCFWLYFYIPSHLCTGLALFWTTGSEE